MLGKYMGVDPELLAKYPGVDPETLAGLVGVQSPGPRAMQSPGVAEDMRWQPAGKLVKEDGKMRFVDSPLLGVIYDEVSNAVFAPGSYTCLPGDMDRFEP
jgi:hypothetical protein